MSWTAWQRVTGDGLELDEIIYEHKRHEELGGGIARVPIAKPEKLNAMTLRTVEQMFRAFYHANHDSSLGAIIVAGAGKHFGVGGDGEGERRGLRGAFCFRSP